MQKIVNSNKHGIHQETSRVTTIIGMKVKRDKSQQQVNHLTKALS